MKLRIANGRMITERGIEQKDILVNGGKIEAIVDRDTPISDDYRRVDCEENFVSAGFVDIHQHGGGGSDYMDDEQDAYLNATNAHLYHGTTSIMPTLTSASGKILLNSIARYKKAEKDSRIKCNILGLAIQSRC